MIDLRDTPADVVEGGLLKDRTRQLEVEPSAAG
jgi:hypothetical protein